MLGFIFRIAYLMSIGSSLYALSAFVYSIYIGNTIAMGFGGFAVLLNTFFFIILRKLYVNTN